MKCVDELAITHNFCFIPIGLNLSGDHYAITPGLLSVFIGDGTVAFVVCDYCMFMSLYMAIINFCQAASIFKDFFKSSKQVKLFVNKVNGGREGRPIGAYELAKAVEELGAGEILLNCIDCDGESNSCSFYKIPPLL